MLPPVLSCDKTGTEADIPAGEPEVVRDSVRLCVRWQQGDAPVRYLDLFIYDSGGTQALEQHIRIATPPDSLETRTLPGKKILVGIANSPRRFNLNALARYDAMTQLAFNFSDDTPHCPVLGGECTSSENTATIPLTPLLCRVRLVSVSNTMDGYELLEDPRVRLIDLPDAAQILRQKDFRPTELLDAGPWQNLPCDVGFFPQHPEIDLWCYPNDTPENILGPPRPSLELECRICGELCSFETPLPPLPRACTVEVEITVDGPGNFRYIIR